MRGARGRVGRGGRSRARAQVWTRDDAADGVTCSCPDVLLARAGRMARSRVVVVVAPAAAANGLGELGRDFGTFVVVLAVDVPAVADV